MKRSIAVLAACAIALPASTLLARVHPFGNAGLAASAQSPSQTLLLEHSSASPEARTLLTEKCADCHSMQTKSHFYGRFAPVSWLMERDIVEGRKAMNLSQWDRYSADQQQTLTAKMVQETKAHEMPLLQYRMIHWDTRITEDDVKTLSAWSHAAPQAATASAPAGAGDAARGKEVFEKRCTGCHSLTENREGPQLQGLYGRTSGAVAGFPYSPALSKAKIVWNDQTLDQWLTDPDAMVPGNNMDFQVVKPQERKDLIAYFKH
jgi:cytochrome c